MPGSKTLYYLAAVGALLIVLGLVAGTVGRGDDGNGNGNGNGDGNGTGGVFYSLTIASTAGGHVSSPGEGNFTYLKGIAINLVATPHTGYHFADWTGNVSTINSVEKAATSITVNGEYSIMANFEADPPARYLLAIMGTPGGSVTVPGEGTFTYGAGTVVNLVATPASGYEFLAWSGAVDTIGDISATSTTITMSGNSSYILICANFRENRPVCGDVHY